jgi:hypothetical protein
MSEQKEISASEKKKEDWMNSKWRPMMGWMYMIVCITDFVLFPVLWSMVQAIHGGNVTTQWNPITLAGAGLFHLAMGAVLGIAAFGRTQEKMAGANNGGLNPPGGFGSMGGGYGSSPGGYGAAPVSNSYGSTPMGGNSMSTYGSPAPSYNSAPGSFGGISAGKARPAEPQYPVL